MKAKEILGEEQFLLFKKVREKGSSWKEARNKLVEMNRGLVGFVIKRFFPSVIGDPLVEYKDAFGEGILGLFEAVDKFDWNFGAAFSTYATFWIKHAIQRFLINQATSSIRIPINVYQAINKMNKKIESLQQKLGKAPIAQEIAEEMEMEPELIERLMMLRFQSKRYTSLDKAITDDEESGSLCEFITYSNQPNPLEIVIARQGQKAFREKIKSLVEAGPFKEKTKKAFYLRFGLKDGEFHILREVGKMMGGVTRERIRQRVEKVLGYLRQPEILKQIKKYLPRDILRPQASDSIFLKTKMSLQEKIELCPKIIELVALLYGLEKSILFSKRGITEKVNRARALVAYIHRKLGFCFREIGEITGVKCFTAQARIYSFERRMERNPSLRTEISLMGKALFQKTSQTFLCGRCQKLFPLEEMRDIHQRKYCRGPLRKIPAEGVKSALKPKDPKVIELVALLYGLEKAALFSTYDRDKVSQAREMITFIYKELGFSFSEISKKMRSKLGTAYARSCSFKKRLKRKPALREELSLIKKALKQRDSQTFSCTRCKKIFPLREMRDVHQKKYCTVSLEKMPVERVFKSVSYPKQSNHLEILIGDKGQEVFREKIKNLVGSSPFPEKIKKSFYLRFGFKDGKFHTLQEVGDMVGEVTREMVRQRKKKVLNYLRQPEIFKQIKEYLPQDILSE